MWIMRLSTELHTAQNAEAKHDFNITRGRIKKIIIWSVQRRWVSVCLWSSVCLNETSISTTCQTHAAEMVPVSPRFTLYRRFFCFFCFFYFRGEGLCLIHGGVNNYFAHTPIQESETRPTAKHERERGKRNGHHLCRVPNTPVLTERVVCTKRKFWESTLFID